jgi:hypothetical protein
MVYVVERYLPGLSRSDLLRGLSRLERGETQAERSAVRYLGSTIVLGDDACFCQFEGPSEEAVAEANHEAGLRFDRIVPALTVLPKGDIPMTVSPSIPGTIEMRRGRLLGLVAAVAVAAAGVTWALLTLTGTDNGASQQSVPTASTLGGGGQRYVDGIASLTPAERAATFGGPASLLDGIGLSPQQKAYVQGITSRTQVERGAAFGGQGTAFEQFVEGITAMAQAQQTAAARGSGTLGASGFDPAFERFVNGISSMARAQQEAAARR